MSTVIKTPTVPFQTAKKKYVNGNQKYDWDQIRNDYMIGHAFKDPETGVIVQKYPTHDQLVEKYGCSIDWLRKKSAKEKWSLLRDSFKTKFREKLNQDNINNFVSQGPQFDAMTLDKLQKLYKLLDIYLSKYGDILDDNALMNGEIPNYEDLPEGVSISLKDLLDLTNILSKCQELVRKTVGEPVQGTSTKEFIEDILKASNRKKDKSDDGKTLDKLIADRENLKKQLDSFNEKIALIDD